MPVTDPRGHTTIRRRPSSVRLGGTLGNWKIAAHRNPVNGYRLFKKADLEALLHQVERSGRHRGHRRRAR